MMRIGIDVGGTNTDAVLMQNGQVLASHKTPTTRDIASGLVRALEAVLPTSGHERIAAIIIGTTQLTNALVERRHLQHVGVIRIGLPAAIALPPMVGWPTDLVQAIGQHVVMVHGGHECDGRPIGPLDEAAVLDAAHGFRRAGVGSVAIASIFSPIARFHEERVAALVRSVIPQAELTLSADLGTLGLLERENAAIINAALAGAAAEIVGSFDRALASLALETPVYLTQNDGTLMDSARARRFPVLTFASGPTNSMRGAMRLSGETDAIVVDIGGTTSDIGALVKGYPRQASGAVDVGGVRTSFRMPDLLTIGIGGGSIVMPGEPIHVGPRSVGYELTHRSRCFGGDVLTATDIAVALGRTGIGNASHLVGLDEDLLRRADARIHADIEAGIDRVKTLRGDAPVVLVGGGAMLVHHPLRGASRTVTPPHSGVANAVGAAAAQVGAEIDRVVKIPPGSRDAVMRGLQDAAIAAAYEAGALTGSVDILHVDEIPIPYAADGARRVLIKAVGELDAMRFRRLRGAVREGVGT